MEILWNEKFNSFLYHVKAIRAAHQKERNLTNKDEILTQVDKESQKFDRHPDFHETVRNLNLKHLLIKRNPPLLPLNLLAI